MGKNKVKMININIKVSSVSALYSDHCHIRPGQKHKRVNLIQGNSKINHVISTAALPPTTASLVPSDTVTPESASEASNTTSRKRVLSLRNNVPQAEHVQSQLQNGELWEGKAEKKYTK